MATLPLLVAHQAKEARLALRLLITRDLTVVIGLIHKGNDEDQDHGPEDGDDPVRPLPLCLPDDKGGHKRTEVRRQDNEARPDVDFASGRRLVYFYRNCANNSRMLVEEEHVLDKHQAALIKTV
jgi:hypothetical protein